MGKYIALSHLRVRTSQRLSVLLIFFSLISSFASHIERFCILGSLLGSMDFRDGAHTLSHKLSRCIVTIGNLGLQLLWYILQITVSAWYSISVVGNLFKSYFISCGVLKKYKSLHLGKVRYLAIVIESEEACQISKVVKLLQWLDTIGVKNVCLYDMNGVLKKSKETIFQKLKNAKSIEEVGEVVTQHAPDHMTLEFLSYVDGKEAVAKAANLIFVENLKRHNMAGDPDVQILLEPQLNEALQIVGSKGPEPDLLLVYGPVRSHLGFPAWRIRYTEIIHMGSLNFMRYGSLLKTIYDYTKVRQNYGT
ncbi:Dehydrodolichyl diphosphate syntase complex subunit NUS1 [Spatholobus suberectus]|nr:Dehydrodolichyl diphosphate syntase complex subunit NUS1 [Spatholobus suberectus]